MNTSARLLAVAIFCLAIGCGGETNFYENEGGALVHPAGASISQLPPNEPVSVEPGEALEVTVELSDCIGCEDIHEMSCEAIVEGDRIEVSARAELVERGGVCPAACGVLTVTCELEPLAAGDYTLSYAGDEVTLSVPSIESPVVGDAGL